MATESVVGIVFQARDEATRVLQQVRGEMALFGPQGQVLVDLGQKADTAALGLRNLGAGANSALPAVKTLTGELLTGFAPALGQVGIALINVTQATERLRLGLPTLAAAGAAAATVFGVELASAVNRSREAF